MTLALPTPVSSGSGSAGRGLRTTSQPLQQRPPGDAAALEGFAQRRKGQAGCENDIAGQMVGRIERRLTTGKNAFFSQQVLPLPI
jgi:hypothetical protein